MKLRGKIQKQILQYEFWLLFCVQQSINKLPVHASLLQLFIVILPKPDALVGICYLQRKLIFSKYRPWRLWTSEDAGR